MAASLSDEEFQRMQSQLLELRTKVYSLEETNTKYSNELYMRNQQLETLKKDLTKAQRAISRSKNVKEVEQLMNENETLQRKLQSQEDEFRLQNQTLMSELSSVISTNEAMKKELDLALTQQFSACNAEMEKSKITLEAENIALKKLLSKHSGDGDSSVGASESDLSSSDIESRLCIEKEAEEKRILQDRLFQLESEHKEQVLKMQNENDKLLEKLKKKQESFLKLQDEKEQLYRENKSALESFQAGKDAEILQFKKQYQDILTQLNALQLNDVSTDGHELEPTVEFIDGEKATFEYSLNETESTMRNFQKKINLFSKQLHWSESKIQVLETSNSDFKSKVNDLEEHKNNLEQMLSEKSKLAEKRKNLMDEMNNHLLETTNKHSTEIENLTRQLSDEQEALQKLFDKEKETKLKLIDARNEVQALKEEIERLKTIRHGTEDKLKFAEEITQKTIADYEAKVQKLEEEHACTIEEMKKCHESELHDRYIEVEVVRAEKVEFEEKATALQQEVKDLIDDRKIQEKKGMSLVKDLKRQLQVERNRAEKLQERLQDILNEQNVSVEEMLQSPGNFEKQKGDASSISSWSYVSGGTAEKENRDGVAQSDNSSCGQDSPNRISPVQLESETQNLLAKIAQIQQKNWTLEEKVNHLEMSNEALVDDVLKKTALIQFYCMEGRSEPHTLVAQDKLTIKRIVDFIKDKGDENLKEINRKMQRMLEETLTKNMHLQKDIETLSNEVSRLSKVVNPPIDIDSTIQSAVFIENV